MVWSRINNTEWEVFRTVVCVIVLSTTHASSPIRWLCLALFTVVLYLQIQGPSITPQTPYQISGEGGLVESYLHQINLLLVTGVDLTSQYGWPRLYSAAKDYVLNVRGIGTPFQVRRLPRGPVAFQSTVNFVLRQLAMALWQYLVADLGLSRLHSLSASERQMYFGVGQEWKVNTAEAWRVRFIATLVFWPSFRALLDQSHRVGSAVCTAVGLTSWQEWPPMFGSFSEAYTLRNFWGKTWHQFLRWPLTSFSNLITRAYLNLERPSSRERYLNNSLVFILSGLSHMTANWKSSVVDGNSGCFIFWVSFMAGYVIEDVVQAVWGAFKACFVPRPPTPPRTWTGLFVHLVERLVGAIWVMAFLTLVTPLWIYPFLRRTPVLVLPYSFVREFGSIPVLTSTVAMMPVLYGWFGARL